MIKDIQKKQEIGIVKKQDILENQAKIVYLGLGSNLGNRKNNIEKAKQFLHKYNVNVIKSSSYYETKSWPNINFPKYFNIVLKVKTNLRPFSLLDKIKLIEKKIGRKSTKKNYPRVCDIDILDYDKKIFNLKNKKFNLQVPHPRLQFRNFVLVPLFEVDKKWKHPKLKENIANLILKNDINDLRSIKFV